MEMKGFKEAPLKGETLGMRKEGSWVIHLLTLIQHILIICANVVLSVKAR